MYKSQKFVGQSQAQVWKADNGDGTYRNPIIHADYSDPDGDGCGNPVLSYRKPNAGKICPIAEPQNSASQRSTEMRAIFSDMACTISRITNKKM